MRNLIKDVSQGLPRVHYFSMCCETDEGRAFTGEAILYSDK